MKHLFIARHGNYGFDSRLDNSGLRQMNNLGRAINEIMNGGSTKVISSTAPRALDSAEALIAQLGLSKFEHVPYLWFGTDSPKDSYYWMPDRYKLLDLVNEQKDGIDGLVMVTHLEVANQFPNFYCEKVLGKYFSIGEISKGRAVHINLEELSYQTLPKW